MKNIKLLICLLFLSYPLVKIWGSDFDLRKAKEYFVKCQCDTVSKEDCEEALRHCTEYLKNEKLDIDKINEVKVLQKEIRDRLECMKSIKTTPKNSPPSPPPPKNSKNNGHKQKNATDYNYEGNTYLTKGHKEPKYYDEAIKCFDMAIKLNPKYEQAYYNRAFAYQNKGDYVSAIADFKQAIDLDPNDGDNYIRLGDVYCEQENYVEAIKYYDKAIRFGNKPAVLVGGGTQTVNQIKAEAYASRGEAHYKLGNRDTAVDDFDKANSLDPNGGYDLKFRILKLLHK